MCVCACVRVCVCVCRCVRACLCCRRHPQQQTHVSETLNRTCHPWGCAAAPCRPSALRPPTPLLPACPPSAPQLDLLCDPRELGESERLALFLNLYNLLTLHAFAALGVPGSLLGRLALMRRAAYNLAGHRYSLYEIEHAVLRAQAARPSLGMVRDSQRDGDRETDRERERERDRDRATGREREREIKKERQTDEQRQRHRDTETQRDTERHRETPRDTERHREPQRDTERHRETQGDTERHREKICHY